MVGDEQASSVRSVDDDAEGPEPLAGGKRGRAAHPPGGRVENLQRSSRCQGVLRDGERVALRIEGDHVGGCGRLMLADYLVGIGVEQGHGTVCVAGREGFPVGAQRERRELLAGRGEDADRRGVAKQRR